MPSLAQYKKNLGSPKTCGEARKYESDMIEEASFTEDINYRIGWFYDYYTDDEQLKYTDLHPEKSKDKTPIEIKFIANAKNSENKDQVGYLIQFKPSFRWENNSKLSWYKDRFIEKYEAEWPIGCFVDIQDEKGVYRKWLITEGASWLNTQFPTWYALPCDHVFQWVNKGKLYQHCGVYRSQSSYNQGTWRDYVFESPENQRKCVMPMNDISSTIFYNTRIILSAPIETPITWRCTKPEQCSPKGSNRLTFAQSEWDEHKDAFEYQIIDEITGEITSEFSSTYDSNKKIVGMWASYYESAIEPIKPEDEIPVSSIYSTISYSGIKPEIKSGGSYKKFTVNFYDGEEEIPFKNGNWKYEIDGKDATSLVTILTHNDSSDVEENQIKIKFNKDDTYIGKILTISYASNDGIESNVDMEIIGL